MKFKKEDLQNLVYDESTVLTKIRNKQVGSGRWDIQYVLIFKFEGHYYRTDYSIGATEQQDVTAFEHDADMIDCIEVWPYLIDKVAFTSNGDPFNSLNDLERIEALL